MKSSRFIYLCLILAALTYSCWAGQNYKLYVNGVLYKAPSIMEKGLPYFPVDVLAEATGVRIVSFNNDSVRLSGSPVDFVPAVRNGRPFLPAEAFALASGSQVETDQTRGIVMYNRGVASSGAGNSAAASAPADTTASGPSRANPGVSPNDPGPEAPVAAPPAAVSEPRSVEGIHETVVDAMKTAQEITYAQRWLKHKMYWVNQMDPANSPYLKVNVPPAAFPMYTNHPWANP